MLEVRNLTKKYGNNTAVDNLSFTVEKGQIYGFLGPNGAGKSTTMNIITGYIAATEGDVFIDGHDILKEPKEAKSCLGYLPELPPLYQDMTVREYLDFAAELKGLSKSERKAAVEMAEGTVKLEEVSQRLIKNLSKGYKQRVGFAQAILGLPELLILDEPTVGLDPKQIIEIRDLIKELGKQHTIILSSHILSEVSAVCDHIMIIAKGKLVASDSAENLMKMMQPVVSLKVVTKAEKAQVESIVSQIPDVMESSVYTSEENGAVEALIKYESQFDLRDAVFKAFTDNGCSILQMNAESASLEDVFLELTAENEKTAAELVADAHAAASEEETENEISEDMEMQPEEMSEITDSESTTASADEAEQAAGETTDYVVTEDSDEKEEDDESNI